ncbi:hypothetical protein BG842_02890, partial [Haladaptatus sp. W1]|uniref:nucleotidyltransferase domain-containing protein n=1 Tax=Haladaptatus sp. W1 TaxID=1897478 RepID=UPI000849DD35
GWTTKGSTTNSSRTYQTVQNAVNNDRYGLGDFEHDYRTHLQGSYANYTNNWGSNDVDVVVKLTKPFEECLDDLDAIEKERYWESYSKSNYTFGEFYDTVHSALKNYFGRENIEKGSKAIKVKANDDTGLEIEADVVPCVEYRKYESFDADGTEKFVEGMWFKTQDLSPRTIINYSEKHRKNGGIKNDHTNENYKPTIRMFKKARDHMESRGYVPEDTASSYFIEGLLFNVPHSRFKKSNLRERYTSILEYLEENNVEDFIEQSKQYDLCVDNDPDRWTTADANATISGYRDLWEEW